MVFGKILLVGMLYVLNVMMTVCTMLLGYLWEDVQQFRVQINTLLPS